MPPPSASVASAGQCLDHAYAVIRESRRERRTGVGTASGTGAGVIGSRGAGSAAGGAADGDGGVASRTAGYAGRGRSSASTRASSRRTSAGSSTSLGIETWNLWWSRTGSVGVPA